MITILLLFASGMLGILTHNFMKIEKINRATNGAFNPAIFFRLEWPSIAISFCVLFACLIGREEIKELQFVGNWLALGFFGIGLAAQSIAYNFKSKSDGHIKSLTSTPASDPEPVEPDGTVYPSEETEKLITENEK
jgi:hypothetical protein